MKKLKIVFSTGAGVSAESGVKTFRDADGLWENYPVMQVASNMAMTFISEIHSTGSMTVPAKALECMTVSRCSGTRMWADTLI